MLATRARMAASGNGGVTFLLRDDFTTDDAAPITSPRTAEPGPGTLTAVQNDGSLAISGSVLNFAAQSSPTWGDLGIWGEAQTRAAGLVMLAKINLTHTNKVAFVGWNQNTNANYAETEYLFVFKTTGTITLEAYTGGAPDYVVEGVSNYAADTDYQLAIITRSTGAFFLIKASGSDWTLLFVLPVSNTSTLYPALAVYNQAGQLDYMRVSQLPSPWNVDNGNATDINSGSVTAGTTFTHEADCLVEYTVTTVPSAGNIDVLFRVQDANNYWIARVTYAGQLSLFEVVAASPVSRGSSGGAVTDGTRIVVIANNDEIRGYADNVLKWTYASASNFKTETAGELDLLGTGGVVSDLVTYPITQSGAAAAALDAVAAV